MEQEIRNCQNCIKDFTIEKEDFNFYEKMKVQAPTFCPKCRMQRRWAFRNERGLYKRKCDFSGKEIFSMFSSDSPVKVYEKEVWLSDAWDAMTYGREIDWSRPFLQQVKELMLDVPFKANNVIRGVNSNYCNNATNPKNSYLVFNTTEPEDCMYSNGVNFSKDCVDVSHTSKAESCYQSFWVTSTYRVHFSSQIADSSDVWFSRDCQGCMNCFGCVNLRNKSYYFFNQQCTKEEYEAKLKEYELHTKEGIERAFKDSREFWKKFPYKNHQGLKNLNCTGSYVTASRNVQNSFLVRDSENLKYCQYLQETPGCKDCYDYSNWGDTAEMLYECISCGTGVQNMRFCWFAQENIHDVEYTMSSKGSSDLFGCVGLRNKQYCILNKQYSKEEYEEIMPRLKAHMDAMPYVDAKGRIYKYGEFFPAEFSPWAYNETIAQEYFPLTKEEAIAQGYRWRDPDVKDYKPTLLAANIPADITEVDDSILNEVFECAHKGECNQGCTKAFRVIPNELQFYKKIGLPLPTLCPACRTLERLQMRLKTELYEDTCKCGGSGSVNGEYKNFILHKHGEEACRNTFQTGYVPNPNTIVYCEDCYQNEVD